MYQDISEEEYRKLSTEEKIKHLKYYQSFTIKTDIFNQYNPNSKYNFECINTDGNIVVDDNSILNDEFTKNIYKKYTLQSEYENDNLKDQYVEDFDITNKKYNNVLHISITSFFKNDKIYTQGIIDKIKLKNFKELGIIPTIILYNLTKANLIKKLDEIVILLKNKKYIDTIFISVQTHSFYGIQNRFRVLNILNEQIEMGEILIKFKFIKNVICVFDGCYPVMNSKNIIDKNIFKKDQHIIILNAAEMGYVARGNSSNGSHLLHSFLYAIYNLQFLFYKDKSSVDRLVLNDIIYIVNHTMMRYNEILEQQDLNYKPSLMISKNVDKYIQNIDHIQLHFYCNQTNYYIDEINEKITKNKLIFDTQVNKKDFNLKINEINENIRKNNVLRNILLNDADFINKKNKYALYQKTIKIITEILDDYNYKKIIENVNFLLDKDKNKAFFVDILQLLTILKSKIIDHVIYKEQINKIIDQLIILDPDIEIEIEIKKITDINYVNELIDKYNRDYEIIINKYKNVKDIDAEINQLYFDMTKLFKAYYLDIDVFETFLIKIDIYYLYNLNNILKIETSELKSDITIKMKIIDQYEKEISSYKNEIKTLYKKFKGGSLG